jgi:hypothetical protein
MRAIAFCILFVAVFVVTGRAQTYEACGDPTDRCSTSFRFEPFDFPFKVRGELEPFGEYRSAEFYVVVLKSRRTLPDPDGLSGPKECSGHFAESDRRKVQAIFPSNKVFTSKFGCDHFQVSYTNVNGDYNFMAVYAGENETEANSFLRQVKGKAAFPGANVRKMQVVLCYLCH